MILAVNMILYLVQDFPISSSPAAAWSLQWDEHSPPPKCAPANIVWIRLLQFWPILHRCTQHRYSLDCVVIRLADFLYDLQHPSRMMWKYNSVRILLMRNRFVVKASGNLLTNWYSGQSKAKERPTCILASLSLATVSWASAASLSLEARWIFSIFCKPGEYSQYSVNQANILKWFLLLHPVLWALWVN